jgi:soluble lytic murein transglycosylase-like protein
MASRVEPLVSSNAGPPDRLIALARKIAAEHQLYPELVCAICEQESSWDPWAIRIEPRFYEKYTKPMLLSDTEEYSRAISWGLMQVMGQTAREHGFLGHFLSELCHPPVGLEIGCRVLAHKLAAAEGHVEKALLLWNGGANKHYAVEVLARARKYEVG